jgi:hypothetical protein
VDKPVVNRVLLWQDSDGMNQPRLQPSRRVRLHQ